MPPHIPMKTLIIIFFLVLPLVYAETGIIEIDDNEIQIIVAGKTTSFNCNETQGDFQFALPDCDKTDEISCIAEKKYNTQKMDEINNDLVNCQRQLQSTKSYIIENSDLNFENSNLKEENNILKTLLVISVIFVVAMVIILMIFNYKKND